uniref:Macrolide 2'-phosphotransferase n=1 Tax=Klebsiella pneumoniae TaxID=573 RepID=A0A8B0SUG0_KLEPN|nr:Macrolide 2'-phosphotransferase [Klebsiella pneumoniae]
MDNDVLWADFTQFIHGDLYAGHVLASKDGAVSGVIDWSTAHIDDPAIDFCWACNFVWRRKPQKL